MTARLVGRWADLIDRRHPQQVYNGWPVGAHIVLTRLSEPSRGKRWEVEMSGGGLSQTYLTYHPSRRAALRYVRGWGVRPIKRRTS